MVATIGGISAFDEEFGVDIFIKVNQLKLSPKFNELVPIILDGELIV